MAQWPNRIPDGLAVVIPAYNESATIRDVVQRALPQAASVVVVDDGSSDDTVAQLADLGVTVLRNASNQGKGASLWHGIKYAVNHGAEAIVTLDGDGQHNPSDIPALVEAAGPDRIVIGARLKNRASAPKARLRANNIADFWISWAAGMRIRDSQSGFRLYPTSIFLNYRPRLGKARGFVFESEVLIDMGRRGINVVSVAIDSCYPEEARASHFRPVRDITRIVVMVAGKLLKAGMYPHGLVRALKKS